MNEITKFTVRGIGGLSRIAEPVEIYISKCIEVHRPKAIILYGSRAGVNYRESSDVDILIISKGVKNRYAEVFKEINFDVIVATEEKIVNRLTRRPVFNDNVYLNILSSGLSIYDKFGRANELIEYGCKLFKAGPPRLSKNRLESIRGFIQLVQHGVRSTKHHESEGDCNAGILKEQLLDQSFKLLVYASNALHGNWGGSYKALLEDLRKVPESELLSVWDRYRQGCISIDQRQKLVSMAADIVDREIDSRLERIQATRMQHLLA